MNNLKRIFSLALATVMVLGMMVVGASATSFTDDADITHDAAVETMAALNIIGGMDDGSFQPNGKVTRAQMAKMITFALNGGKDPKVGTPITSSFTDTTTHWAAEYIEYCANLGIIGGRGDGTFDPEGKVKANEAAKMLLVAIGYDAETFGFGGPNWSANVLRMATTLLIGGELQNGKLVGASSLNLFDGLAGVAADAELTRDQAAQLIYNGIQANGVLMSLTGVVDGKPSYTYSLTGPSILVDKFGAAVETGVLVDISYTKATKSSPATWSYTTSNGTDEFHYNTTIDVSDLFMQNVRAVAQGNNVLSITAAADDVVSTGAFGGIKTTKVDGIVTRLNGYKVDGNDASKLTMYSLEDDAKLTTVGNPAKYTGNVYDEYRLIDNDGDGSIDCVVVVPVTLTTVKTVASKAITLTAGGQITFEGNNIEDGLTKGEYVTVTTARNGAKTVKAAETMTGLVTGSRTTAAGTTLRVDGEWYPVADTAKGGQLTTTDATDKLNGHECDLVLVAGQIVAGKPVEAVVNASDAVMVVAAADNFTKNTGVDVTVTEYQQIRVLKNDGTTQVLNVISIDDKAVAENTNAAKPGDIFTYTEDRNAEGYYNLTTYTGKDDYKVYMNASTINKGLATGKASTVDEKGNWTTDVNNSSFRFADEADIFVLAGNKAPYKYAVVKGSEVNKWAQENGYKAANGSLLLATASANGFTYVQTGFLILDGETKIPGAGANMSTGYGMVTANAVRVLGQDNKYYLNLTIWNGAEEIEVTTTESVAFGATANYTAGTMVTYTDNNNGTISGLTSINDKMDAVVAYDGINTIKFAKGGANEYTIANDAVIVYVDLANGTGADGVIELATPAEDDKGNQIGYYGNVWVGETHKSNGVQYVDYLIVDVSEANVGVDEAVVK